MISRIKTARRVHRAAVEVLYEDMCTIYEYRSVMDNNSKLTSKQEVPVIEKQPCKLSFESMETTVSTDSANEKSVSIKLFISPDIRIKPGSKIVITHGGIETAFSNSGVPALYPTHQEIDLKLFERWA